MTKTKKDLLLVIILLIIAAAGFAINNFIRLAPASYVEVSVDGQVQYQLDINQDTELLINGWNGGTNHLIVKDHTIWIDEASCPDKRCIHQGKITAGEFQLNGQLISCRPHRLIVRIVSQEH